MNFRLNKNNIEIKILIAVLLFCNVAFFYSFYIQTRRINALTALVMGHEKKDKYSYALERLKNKATLDCFKNGDEKIKLIYFFENKDTGKANCAELKFLEDLKKKHSKQIIIFSSLTEYAEKYPKLAVKNDPEVSFWLNSRIMLNCSLAFLIDKNNMIQNAYILNPNDYTRFQNDLLKIISFMNSVYDK